MNKNKFILLLLIGMYITLMSSCVSVEQYQKMYINDVDMELSDHKISTLESKAQTYREAASGANGGKSGGGCGCN